MKRCILILGFCIAAMLTSCDQKKSIVKELAIKTAEAVNNGDKSAIFKYYPSAAGKNLITNIEDPTFRTQKITDSLYRVEQKNGKKVAFEIFVPGIDATIKDSWNFFIKDSCAAVASERIGIPEDLSDIEFFDIWDLQEESFLIYEYIHKLNENEYFPLSIRGGLPYTYYRFSGIISEWRPYVTVKNVSNKIVKAKDYSLIHKCVGANDSVLDSKKIPARDLKPGEEFRFEYTANLGGTVYNEDDFSWTVSMTFKNKNYEDLSSIIERLVEYYDGLSSDDFEEYNEYRAKEGLKSYFIDRSRIKNAIDSEDRTLNKDEDQNAQSGFPKVYSNSYDGYTNIRESAASSAKIVGILRNGPKGASRIGDEGEWVKIDCDGTVGYVYSKYVTDEPTEEVTVDLSSGWLCKKWVDDFDGCEGLEIKSNGTFLYIHSEDSGFSLKGTWRVRSDTLELNVTEDILKMQGFVKKKYHLDGNKQKVEGFHRGFPST